MNRTKIEWATNTWNPVTGCLHGCQYCYARRIADRFGGRFDGESNTSTRPLKEFAKGIYLDDQKESMDKSGQLVKAPFPYDFLPTFHAYRLDEPAKLKKPARIFVVSMGDLFGDWVPDNWIIEVFWACREAPQHKYLFLTKNPNRYVELADKGLLPNDDNFWYGQTCTKGTIKAFYAVKTFCPQPHYHQFLSAEPLQGFVDAYGFEWIITGAETGNRKGKHVPTKPEVFRTVWINTGKHFMKDSLVPIVGEENMVREIPRGLLLEQEYTNGK